MAIQDNGTFMGDYVHGGQISEDSFYRVWVRDQEYAEGTLDSGSPARDDGHLRKAGFRFDKNLGSDLNLYVAGGFATRRVEHVLDLSNRLLHDPASSFLTFAIFLHIRLSLMSASNQQWLDNLDTLHCRLCTSNSSFRFSKLGEPYACLQTAPSTAA